MKRFQGMEMTSRKRGGAGRFALAGAALIAALTLPLDLDAALAAAETAKAALRRNLPTRLAQAPDPVVPPVGREKPVTPADDDSPADAPPPAASRAPGYGSSDDLGVLDRVQDWLARANREYQGTVIRELSLPAPEGEDVIARKLEDERKAEEARKAEAARVAAESANRLSQGAEKTAPLAQPVAPPAGGASTQQLADDMRREREKLESEAARIEAERKAAEEKRLAEDRKRTEEAAAKAEAERRAAEEKRLAEERKRAEVAAAKAEAERKAAEEKRLAEERKRAEVAAAKAEAERKAAEEKRLAEDRKRTEEAAAKAEAERKAAEEKRLAEDRKRREEAAAAEAQLKAAAPPSTAGAEPEASPPPDGASMAGLGEVRPRGVTRPAAVERWVKRNRGPHCRRAGRKVRPPGRYVVAPGDSLWRISRSHYGFGRFYRAIYRANRRTIHDPDLIYPCRSVVIPRRRR